MPSPGDIFHYENFVFDDGTIRNKFFIVLHSDPCLMLITTSQSLRYPNVRPGCNPDKGTFFVPIGKNQVFPKPTYLVLPKIYELPRQEVKNLLAARRITKKDPITTRLFLDIKDCLSHFRDDIADEHWDMIFTPGAPSAASLHALAKKFNKKG